MFTPVLKPTKPSKPEKYYTHVIRFSESSAEIARAISERRQISISQAVQLALRYFHKVHGRKLPINPSRAPLRPSELPTRSRADEPKKLTFEVTADVHNMLRDLASINGHSRQRVLSDLIISAWEEAEKPPS